MFERLFVLLLFIHVQVVHGLLSSKRQRDGPVLDPCRQRLTLAVMCAFATVDFEPFMEQKLAAQYTLLLSQTECILP